MHATGTRATLCQCHREKLERNSPTIQQQKKATFYRFQGGRARSDQSSIERCQQEGWCTIIGTDRHRVHQEPGGTGEPNIRGENGVGSDLSRQIGSHHRHMCDDLFRLQIKVHGCVRWPATKSEGGLKNGYIFLLQSVANTLLAKTCSQTPVVHIISSSLIFLFHHPYACFVCIKAAPQRTIVVGKVFFFIPPLSSYLFVH